VIKSTVRFQALTTPTNFSAKPHPAAGENLFRKIISARKGYLAYLPLIVAVIILAIAAKVGSFFVNPDMLRYECYGTAFWFGTRTSQLLPAAQCQFISQISHYHTFPLEYPPLTFIIFSLPLLVPVIEYPLAFALFMAVIVSIVYLLLIRYGPQGAGIAFAGCLILGCLVTTLARFDIVPAALTLLCLILAEHKRWTLAYIALALGVLIKLYPIALFPLLFLAEQREQAGFFTLDQSASLKKAPTILFKTFRNMRTWRWKNAIIFICVVVGLTACFWVLNPKGTLGTLFYFDLRPYQIESTGSILLWLFSFFGSPIEWSDSFGSLNIVSPIASVISPLFIILLGLVFSYILIQQWKGKMDLVQASLAALLVMVATNKVFSPQYLIWLIPLLAYSATSNRRVWLFWSGISILTTVIFPIYYSINTILNRPSPAPGFLPVILLRNGLFIVFMVGYLFNFLNLRERSEIQG
jgi:hypothetical protein